MRFPTSLISVSRVSSLPSHERLSLLAIEGTALARGSKLKSATCDTEDTLKTMLVDAYVNHVPVMTGGVGHDELREFYSKRFIPQMPPDTQMTPVSRT